MNAIKKINVDFDYSKLRNDVASVTKQIKAEAVSTIFEGQSTRNICLTVPTQDSDDWTDGSAGKT